MIFVLGISITLNIISAVAFFLIYKYSLKGMKKNIQSFVYLYIFNVYFYTCIMDISVIY